MGRRSKLSPSQWADIGRRLLEGEGASELGREFGVTESTIRGHFERTGQKTTVVREVANMVASAKQATDTAQKALQALPAEAQVAANSLAAKLISISASLADAADDAAKTARRLHALANSEAQKIDDAQPMLSSDSLKSVMVLTDAGNEAARMPLNLLSANRDQMKRINEDEPPKQDDVLTPERMKEGARRMAFTLARAGAMETN